MAGPLGTAAIKRSTAVPYATINNHEWRVNMRSMKLIGVAAVAVVVLFAVAASSAFARTGPRFYVEGALLGANESIESQAKGTQILAATGVEVECAGVSLEPGTGKLLTGNPGTNEETLLYSGCVYKGKTAAQCEAKSGIIKEQIKTKLLDSELVFKAAIGTETDTLFKPAAPPEFATIKFAGTECPLAETKVNGSVAVENTTANEPKEDVKDVLTAPAVAIKKVFNAAGNVETKPKLTVTGGFVATYSGQVEVWLTGANEKKKWGVKE
jgi:hypothetical protein